MSDATLEEIAQLTAGYPHFPDGRIDYSHARVCPVINCVVVFGDKALLTRRSNEVISYPNCWNGISGFIDTLSPLPDIARQELHEEVALPESIIAMLQVGSKLIVNDVEINRQWIVFPVLVELQYPHNPTLNWENKNASWVPLDEVAEYEVVPGFTKVFQAALALRRT